MSSTSTKSTPLLSLRGLTLLITLLFYGVASAQLSVGPDTTICAGGIATLHATYTVSGGGGPGGINFGNLSTVSLTDDTHSGVVPIGFSFDFYGNTYTQCVISSNNYITFDLTQANNYSPWAINNPIPNAGMPTNAIMCPYQDINPGNGGVIEYGTIGTAPNRIFVVRYLSVPMFSCTNDFFCSAVFLFEGSNRIETHLENKPLCAGWNGGVSIHGLHNANGTIADVVPGRNYPTQWTATQDAWEFVPNGTSAYNINTIPFITIISNNNAINWYSAPNGTFVGTGSSISVIPSSTTTYYAEMDNNCSNGGSGSTVNSIDSATVTVIPVAAPSLNITDAACAMSNDGSVFITPNTGSAPWTYDVILTGNSVANGTSNGPFTVDNLAMGSYLLTFSDSFGCSTTTPFNIGGANTPPPTITATDASCAAVNDGTVDAVSNFGTAPYTFNLLDNAGNQIATVTSSTNGFFSNLGVGNYTIEVIDANGCSATQTFAITSAPPIVVTASNDTTICSTGMAGISAIATGGNGGPYTYTWNQGLVGNGPHDVFPLTGTEYIVFATDGAGCTSDNDTVRVDVNPTLSATLTMSADTICPGETILLNAEANGGSGIGYSYEWSDGISIIGTTQQLTVSPMDDHTYCVTVRDDCETPQVTECITVIVGDMPPVTFETDTNAACAPALFAFQNTTPTNAIGSVLWDFGDGNTSTDPIVTYHTYPDTGTYDITLTITTPEGCIIDTFAPNYLTVHPNPIASFEANPQPTNIFNTEINFTNTSSGHIQSFWDFAGLDASTDENPTYEFPIGISDDYLVTLTVTNEWNCKDTDTFTVVIQDDLLFFVPNSFTPNGDGLNDYFAFQGLNVSDNRFEAYIYDRWGGIVWQSSDPAAQWDGKDKYGQPVELGVYVWYVRARTYSKDEPFERIGHVTVIR